MRAPIIERTRGDDWSIHGVIGARTGPVDLTGATVRAQLRRSTEDPTIAATFTVVMADAPAGRIVLTVSAVVTAELTPGAYVYDIEVVKAGRTVTFGRGYRLLVKGDVTR